MADIIAIPFRSAAVSALVEKLQEVLDVVGVGEMSVAEAVGALELVKMDLWARCQTDDEE